jgi:hypothetical protein
MNLRCLSVFSMLTLGANTYFKDSDNTIHLSLRVHVLSVKTYTDGYIQLMRQLLGSVSGTSLNFFKHSLDSVF